MELVCCDSCAWFSNTWSQTRLLPSSQESFGGLSLTSPAACLLVNPWLISESLWSSSGDESRSTTELLVQSSAEHPHEEIQAVGLSNGGDSWVYQQFPHHRPPRPPATRIIKPGSRKTRASQPFWDHRVGGGTCFMKCFKSEILLLVIGFLRSGMIFKSVNYNLNRYYPEQCLRAAIIQ